MSSAIEFDRRLLLGAAGGEISTVAAASHPLANLAY